MLDVQILALLITHLQQQAGVLFELACSVDLQFHTEEAWACPIENRFGFVIIVVDGRGVGQGVETARAVRGFVIVVVFGVVGLGLVEQRSAPATVGVVVIVASLADGDLAAARVVLLPNSLPAVAAEQRPLVQAVRTKFQSVKGIQIFARVRIRLRF
ncbi:hypothetical protein [Flavonifractor hominis]|uniref:Secreted protein n=1 Tax=Flavonifractor hominis TaxID=3133178 RepID=A0ABV1EMD6_9FIRM